jgi:hypothetical protein
MKILIIYKGGQGSGNFDHAGRPGQVGGSAADDDGVASANSGASTDESALKVDRVRDLCRGCSAKDEEAIVQATKGVPDAIFTNVTSITTQAPASLPGWMDPRAPGFFVAGAYNPATGTLHTNVSMHHKLLGIPGPLGPLDRKALQTTVLHELAHAHLNGKPDEFSDLYLGLSGMGKIRELSSFGFRNTARLGNVGLRPYSFFGPKELAADLGVLMLTNRSKANEAIEYITELSGGYTGHTDRFLKDWGMKERDVDVWEIRTRGVDGTLVIELQPESVPEGVLENTPWYYIKRQATAKVRITYKGGPGSGNFDHAGRPGQVGGSASSDSGVATVAVSHTNTSRARIETSVRDFLAKCRAHPVKTALDALTVGYTAYTTGEAIVGAIETRDRLINKCPDGLSYIQIGDRKQTGDLLKSSILSGLPASVSSTAYVLKGIREKTDLSEAAILVSSEPGKGTKGFAIIGSSADIDGQGTAAITLSTVSTRENDKAVVDAFLDSVKDTAVKSGIDHVAVALVRSKWLEAHLLGLGYERRGDVYIKRVTGEKGGQGSGNFDHAGRPGQVGGSASSDSAASEAVQLATRRTTQVIGPAATSLIGTGLIALGSLGEAKTELSRISQVRMSDPKQMQRFVDSVRASSKLASRLGTARGLQAAALEDPKLADDNAVLVCTNEKDEVDAFALVQESTVKVQDVPEPAILVYAANFENGDALDRILVEARGAAIARERPYMAVALDGSNRKEDLNMNLMDDSHYFTIRDNGDTLFVRRIRSLSKSRVKILITYKGGQGSGYFGHAGRPGEEGGSAPSDSAASDRRSRYRGRATPRGKPKTWGEAYRQNPKGAVAGAAIALGLTGILMWPVVAPVSVAAYQTVRALSAAWDSFKAYKMNCPDGISALHYSPDAAQTLKEAIMWSSLTAENKAQLASDFTSPLTARGKFLLVYSQPGKGIMGIAGLEGDRDGFIHVKFPVATNDAVKKQLLDAAVRCASERKGMSRRQQYTVVYVRDLANASADLYKDEGFKPANAYTKSDWMKSVEISKPSSVYTGTQEIVVQDPWNRVEQNAV